jgi:hypothetical protein
MKTANPEARIPYLSLALLAQKVIDSLIEFRERGEKPSSFDDTVGKALQALRAAEAKGTPQAPRSALSTLPKYEHLLTLNEAWKSTEVSETAQSLEALLNSQGELQDRMYLAEKVIEKFFRLENQALWNFERPSDPLPRGIRELCKAP